VPRKKSAPLLRQVILAVVIFFGGMLWSPLLYSKEDRQMTLAPEQQRWLEQNPNSLPIWMTPEEEQRKHEIGKDFRGTPPPPPPVRMPAEFEPMTGVLIRWPLGIPYDVIAEMSEDVEVWTIVANSSQQSQAMSAYASHGVNTANCYFLIADTESYWTRDYGPWYIFNGYNQQGIVDHIYNRPRPNDDEIPFELGVYLGIPVYGMDLVATGGNYMCDGLGVAMSTRLTYDENPDMTEEEVKQVLFDYSGITQFYGLPYIEQGGIHHIDCWAKFLSPNKILVEEQSPFNPALEANVDFLETLMSSWGTFYEIVRIPVQGTEAYTNSLILNNKVLVPLFGTANDSVALQIYEDAMPGYEVIGFDGSWLVDDALHCRVKGIVDRYMLYISHSPLLNTEETVTHYPVEAEIFPYSGMPLSPGSPDLYYSVNGSGFAEVDMTPLGSNYYRAYIPAQSYGTAIRYYIHAEDDSGRSENHPYVGGVGAHTFHVALDNTPPVITHTPLDNQSLAQWPATVTSTVFDITGPVEMVLEYRVNTVDQTPIIMNNVSGSTYEAQFAASVEAGDLVQYRIRATDDAIAHNVSYHPSSGYHEFAILTSIPVFLWNPSGSPSANASAVALESLGVPHNSGSSLPADLGQYSAIFVFLGVYPENHVLTNSEGEALAAYLDQGGYLYLEGADTWAFDNPTPVHSYFHISGIADGSGDCGPVNGVSGTFTEGMSFGYGGNNNYIDRLSPASGAFTIMRNGNPVYDSCIAYDSGSYKSIGCSFDFGGLTDGTFPSTKENLISAYLDFFTAVERTITVTYPNGGETWYLEESQTISWLSQNVPGNVKIEISHDQGSTWSLVESSTPNAGSYPWTVDSPTSSGCRIRLSSISYPSVDDTSDADFTITVQDICQCDLDQSGGSCNFFDWLTFIEDWDHCIQAGCSCDLNQDGSCNFFDWLIFIEDWGRTDCPIL
jgi:agmatine/peptidylarginine deiminase